MLLCRKWLSIRGFVDILNGHFNIVGCPRIHFYVPMQQNINIENEDEYASSSTSSDGSLVRVNMEFHSSWASGDGNHGDMGLSPSKSRIKHSQHKQFKPWNPVHSFGYGIANAISASSTVRRTFRKVRKPAHISPITSSSEVDPGFCSDFSACRGRDTARKLEELQNQLLQMKCDIAELMELRNEPSSLFQPFIASSPSVTKMNKIPLIPPPPPCQPPEPPAPFSNIFLRKKEKNTEGTPSKNLVRDILIVQAVSKGLNQ